MFHPIPLLAVLGLLSSTAHAADWGDFCTPKRSTPLGDIQKGSLQLDDTGTVSYADWSSSFLQASGKKPTPNEGVDMNDPDDAEMQMIAEFDWSCMYSAERVKDGNPKTAWVEGVAGHGEGEVVIARVDISKPIEIYNGYGKSQRLFETNSRIAKAKIHFLSSSELMIGQGGNTYSKLRIVKTAETLLEDTNGYQTLKVTSPPTQEGQTTFIALEVVTVYPGSKYSDTAVSEIRNVKR